MRCIVSEPCNDDAVEKVSGQVCRGATLGGELICKRRKVNATICRSTEGDEEDLGQCLVLGQLLLAWGGCHRVVIHYRIITANDVKLYCMCTDNA